jgi:two-component system, NarL family, response regulator LiaR
MSKIRVVVADDHPAFREGLCRLLSDEKELEVIGQAANGIEVVNLTRSLNPDVAILDISMPKLNGIEATKQIKECSPNTTVLMLSAFIFHNYVVASLKAGASGYVTKDTPLCEILSAVRIAHAGDKIIGHRVANSLIKQLISRKTCHTGNSGLNAREIEVIKLTAGGKRNKEIAFALHISERTVQSHMVNIFSKLNVNSRIEAVMQAFKEGWLDRCDL